jgi:triacylglycerol lipase
VTRLIRLAVTTAMAAAVAIVGNAAAAPAPSLTAGPGPALDVPAPKLADALSCPRTLSHKVVLLVHGTSVTAEENWGWNYVLALPHYGFDVCTVLLPDRELSDVQVSSEYVVYAIRAIHERTQSKLDVIGLSQGALQPRWAIKWWPDIRTDIDDYVSMAGTNHGALFGDLDCVYECPPALWQQVRSSRFLAALNKGDETPGSVSYTSVYSLTDDIIQPAAPTPVAAIAGASNVAVQDVCPGRYVGHVQSASDAGYFGIVLDALTHLGPADPSRVDRDYCTQTFMPYVDPATAIRRTAEVYLFAGIVQGEHAKTTSEPPLKWYAK